MEAYVGFSSSNNFVGRAIQWFTRSKVNHTWILLKDFSDGLDMVMQASTGGFQLITYQRFLKGATVVAVVRPKVSLDKGIKEALQWLGEPYDFVGIVGMALVEVGRWFRRSPRNWLHSSRAMWCSEANVYVLKAAGYPGASVLDPTVVSPEDLLEFMQG